MFRCGICNEPQPTHSTPTRVVVATRDRQYPPRPWANDPGGFGHEIAKELNICDECNDMVAEEMTEQKK